MFSFAKNGTTNIFIKIKAGNPKPSATRALAVSETSVKSNSPQKTKILLFLPIKIIFQKMQVLKKIPNSKAFEILSLASAFLFSTCFESIGNNAVLIAIPNTPSGN